MSIGSVKGQGKKCNQAKFNVRDDETPLEQPKGQVMGASEACM